MLRMALLIAAALPLAACGGDGTSISINAKTDGEGGNSVISTDANGQMAIKAGGFEGSFKLPKFNIDAEEFDVNGVKLYPGSKISNLAVDSDKSGGKDQDKVTVSFDSPAAEGTVLGWFREAMTKHGFTVESTAQGLKGSTDEGDPFNLIVTPAGEGKSTGKLEILG